MAVLKIFTSGSPILKKKAKSVKKVTSSHIKLINDMIETMKNAPGVGLAAPQVGISERIIIADIGEGTFCLINPKITKKSGKQEFYEACLSVPGFEAPVERFKSVVVKALDKTGKPVSIDAEGFLAVVFQHEIDHLDGILFVDRVKDTSLIKPRTLTEEETI